MCPPHPPILRFNHSSGWFYHVAPPIFLGQRPGRCSAPSPSTLLAGTVFFSPPVHVKQPHSRNHGLVGNSHIYPHICIYIYIYYNVYIYIYIIIYIYILIIMFIYIYIRIYSNVYIYTRIYIYIIGTIWGVCNLRIIRGMGFVCFCWGQKTSLHEAQDY